MSTQPLPRVSQEEYLDFERQAEGKHEFIDGEIVAMAGGSPAHARIATNIVIELGSRLQETGRCLVFNSDLRVTIAPNRLISYPDVTVVCGDLQYTDDRRDTITNPVLVVEVLSPSTERFDRGGKAQTYRAMQSVREFLLVDQRPTGIEHWTRLAQDRWSVTEIRDREAVLRLESIGCELPAAGIYRDVERLLP